MGKRAAMVSFVVVFKVLAPAVTWGLSQSYDLGASVVPASSTDRPPIHIGPGRTWSTSDDFYIIEQLALE